MIKSLILLIAVVLFCTGVYFLWKIFFFKNTPQAASSMVTIGTHTYPVEIASTFEQKVHGLAGRDSLTTGHGMLFPFGSKSRLSFTMKGMRFPLDIIWIADGKIVDVSRNLAPDTGLVAMAYRPVEPADTVLELAAGTADRDGLKIGDTITIEYHG